MDWTVLVKSHFVWGFGLGLVFLALSLWGHLGTKREFRRYRKHLSDKLDLDAAQLEGLKRDKETLAKENENLRLRVGMLGEKQFGRIRLFINGENLTGVRQTDWDPLLLPTRAPDGRWTVDAWAPLDGRTVNGGIRLMF